MKVDRDGWPQVGQHFMQGLRANLTRLPHTLDDGDADDAIMLLVMPQKNKSLA